MNSADQLQFVSSLTEAVKNQFAEALRAGEVPADWDGYELRQWLADKFAAEVIPMNRRALKEYQNTVAVSTKL